MGKVISNDDNQEESEANQAWFASGSVLAGEIIDDAVDVMCKLLSTQPMVAASIGEVGRRFL